MIIKFSENVMQALEARIRSGKPDLETDLGALYLLRGDSIAAVVPKPNDDEGLGNFLRMVREVPEDKRTVHMDMIPTGKPSVPIVVTNEVAIKDGKTYLAGKEVILLP